MNTSLQGLTLCGNSLGGYTAGKALADMLKARAGPSAPSRSLQGSVAVRTKRCKREGLSPVKAFPLQVMEESTVERELVFYKRISRSLKEFIGSDQGPYLEVEEITLAPLKVDPPKSRPLESRSW